MAISVNTTPIPSRAIADRLAAQRVKSLRVLTITIGVLTGLAAAGLLWLYFMQHRWQTGALGLLFAITALVSLLSNAILFFRGRTFFRLLVISICFALAVTATAAFLSGPGFPAAVVYLIFALIISSMAEKDWQANTLISLGILIAGAAALLTEYSPFAQFSLPLFNTFTLLLLGSLFIMYAVMLATQFVITTLRIRLVTAFLAIVIIPLAILSVIQSRFTFSVLTNEVTQALKLTAQQTAAGVDRFMNDKQRSIMEAAQQNLFSTYLALPAQERRSSPQDFQLRTTMRIMDTNEVNSSIYISSYALLDNRGVAVYDTLLDRVTNRFSPEILRTMGIDLGALINGEGVDESAQQYFQVPYQTGATYISDVEITNSSRGFFYISAPVRNKDGEIIGVLRARYDGLLLQDLLHSYSGQLGKNSYAILLDENNIRLADAYTPNNLYKSIAPLPAAKIEELKNKQRLPDLPAHLLSTNFTDLAKTLETFNEQNPVFQSNLSPGLKSSQQEIGAFSRMNTRPWKVIYLRSDYSDEALRRDQRRLATLVTVLIAALVGVIAVGASQLLSNPIIQLTRTAQKIHDGDLDAQVEAKGSDELGTLGAAFNSMTSQLRTLIAQLEDRVKARTQEIEKQNLALANRASQLQTVSEVARQIVSSQELENLLSSVTHLVSERFGFYHVGIFLLDEKREYAILRASNSAGGQKMLARQHMLPVGKVGMVGYATGTGQARIATDVGDDAIYFNNPDLPETRSEIALPLKVGDQIIGALDIQSTKPNDFQPDDIYLFSTLSDQVAIAIYNNQLYIETARALEESRSLHRKYLRSEWDTDTQQRKVLGYVYNRTGITPQQSENPLWKKVFSSGEAVFAALPGGSDVPGSAMMAVPIAVRGETIGVIHVQDQGQARLWSEDEIALVNSIASQVAGALENVRLFENTVRRAEREKKAMQITAKIRSTNNPEEMMQIALSELQQALKATRTQIYIRQDNDSAETQPAATSSDNGKSG